MLSARHRWLALTGLVAVAVLGACNRSPTAPASDIASSPAFQKSGRPPQFNPNAQCSEALTGAPTGPATVSAKSTAYGRVLAVGSGDYAGCTLYLLTSDQLHALTGGSEPYACSDNSNPLGHPCDTFFWPALLTDGAPVAGPGINPTLLGTVTRTDMTTDGGTDLGTVQQVTYNGYPLYRFFLDEGPTQTDGANLFDPVTSPTGIWYLVHPSRGRVAPGTAHLAMETAPVGGPSGSDATVLAVTMDHGFEALPDGAFPVYTLSTDSHQGPDKSACTGECAAVDWPPVLTSTRPVAGTGVDQNALGILVRPDGTHQVTYEGHPLYLFYNDAYIPGAPYNGGVATINGGGASTPWGVFNTIPSLP